MFSQKMEFYGMSSEEAQLKYYGEKQSYRASEGKKVQIPYKGPVKNTVEEILGGLRSACTYAGARTIKSLPSRRGNPYRKYLGLRRTLATISGWYSVAMKAPVPVSQT